MSHMMWQPEAFIDIVFSARQKRSMADGERATRRSQPITSAKVRAATCLAVARKESCPFSPLSSRGFQAIRPRGLEDRGCHRGWYLLCCSEILSIWRFRIPIELTVSIASVSCSNRYRVSTRSGRVRLSHSPRHIHVACSHNNPTPLLRQLHTTKDSGALEP